MTITSPPAASTQLRRVPLAKGPFPKNSPSPTSLAAFSKHGRLLSPRDKNQPIDAASSTTTVRTASIGSSQDCRSDSDSSTDLLWDALSSTSSSGDQDLEGWVSPSRSSGVSTLGHTTKVTSPRRGETGRWSDARHKPQSHTLHHAAPWAGRSVGASWQPALASTARMAVPLLQPPHRITSPMLVPTHIPTSTGMPLPKQGLATNTLLPLTPVHLASLAHSSVPTTTFAPRLRPVVHAIHIGPPTEYDFRNTNGLMKCLNAMAPQPTSEQLSAKHLVINELQRIVDNWMQRTFPEQDDATATLLLGGSWHLKVGMADSDLDIVALLPKSVTSEVFFTALYDHLQSIAAVTKLVAMDKATVPILAFQLHHVRIDLLFARFTESHVPKNLPIHSDQILVGMDATSMRSLSVPRVASLILELVPNDSAFRSCLRIVRLWAKRRGIYSNKAGFLGGISWTILVAFVCQLFPKATISSIIHRFFSILSTWHWPTPILLAKPYECAGVDSSVQWCPQTNHHDRGHVMPIITPGFPAVNSAVNVNASTLRILKEEFVRGKRILDDMQCKGLSSPAVWQTLFAPTEFLIQYDHYVVVHLHASSHDDLTEWSNFVASRTRKLVDTLHHSSSIQDIHPYPQVVPEPSADCGLEKTCVSGYYFVGFKFPSNAASDSRHRRHVPNHSVKHDDAMRASVASAIRYFTATELGKCSERRAGMSVEIAYRKWQELPESVFPQGRTVAAGERARHILSRAHTTHVARSYGQ